MKLTFLVAILSFSITTIAQQVSIIPQPASLKVNSGSFVINKTTSIVISDETDRKSANFLNSYLKEYYGFALPITKKATTKSISLVTRKFIKAPEKDAYLFESSANGVTIEGDTYAGTFYGIQTLIQLLPIEKSASLTIASVNISDAPQLGYRGMHLDVCRHFFPISYVKKYIDFLALHKLNNFHWHLTDDQGWRIEIKKYPKLTSIGGWRNGTIIGRYPGKGNDSLHYGGFYTQEQIKEVVKYAADRFITVIPEIEMPGHASAAIAAYPELSCFPTVPTKATYPKNCAWAGDTTGKQTVQTWGVFEDVFCAGKENTFKFLQDVVDEVMPLFPSVMFHVGGDECPKANWKKCPHCQQRMKENNLKDEHELQSYFVQRMEKYINAKGKTIIGWDEILEGGLAPNAWVMSWRGEKGGIEAAKQHHNVIMTPQSYVYFDHTQSRNEDSVTIGGYNNIEKVYNWNPVPAELSEEEAKYIKGGQANLWTEYIKNTRKIEYSIFPRMAALSETLWGDPAKKNWDDFQKRLPVQLQRYDRWNANYSRAYYDMQATVIPSDKPGRVLWKLENKANLPMKFMKYNNADSAKVDSVLYASPIEIDQAGLVVASINLQGRSISIAQNFSFNKATGQKIQLLIEPSKKYPGDGAFTLINGVQNEKGLNRSSEFLGFEGTDCSVVIDFGKPVPVSELIVHTFEQPGSWIYHPKTASVEGSDDGKYFKPISNDTRVIIAKEKNTMTITPIQSATVRYLKVMLTNKGIIEDGLPGAGHKAWLFVDEIEVN